jgi:cold shock CspA family protein
MPQGTVKSFDPRDKTAVVLDDTLHELVVDREAFAASGLLELRLGQRVRFETEDLGNDGQRLTNLHLITL